VGHPVFVDDEWSVARYVLPVVADSADRVRYVELLDPARRDRRYAAECAEEIPADQGRTIRTIAFARMVCQPGERRSGSPTRPERSGCRSRVPPRPPSLLRATQLRWAMRRRLSADCRGSDPRLRGGCDAAGHDIRIVADSERAAAPRTCSADVSASPICWLVLRLR